MTLERPEDLSEDALLGMLRSADAEDRAYAALNLLFTERSSSVLAGLRSCLGDEDDQVRGSAAQSLAMLGDAESFERILLLANAHASEARPEVWAVVALAKDRSRADRARVQDLLDEMSRSTHDAVRAQAELLQLELDDNHEGSGEPG